MDGSTEMRCYCSWSNVAFMKSGSPMDEGRRHKESYDFKKERKGPKG